MEIGSTRGATGTQSGALTATIGRDELGRDQFMKLLTVQLQHQDPLNPVTNEAFLGQLAQFSSLEQMQAINKNLETSQLLDHSINNFLAGSLIGREVRMPGDSLVLGEGGPAEFAVALEGPARVAATIEDAGGTVVRTLDLGGLDAGESRIVWDGRDDAGRSLPAGSYRISVAAAGEDGSPARIETAVTGRVSALRFREGRAFLVVDGRETSVDEVLEIRPGE